MREMLDRREAKDPNDILARRLKVMGNSPLFYEKPLQFVRGEGVYLYTPDGERYLDCYNNIPGVGHCNPRVVEAISRQAAVLNVHSRYISENVIAYSERLLSTFENEFDRVMFTCTGSESNDQAIRIARMMGNGRGIICTNLAYHGNTSAVDQVSPLFHRVKHQYTDVRAIPFPDTYRPMNGLEGEALVEAHLSELQDAIDSLVDSGAGLAGMIICSIFANEGLPKVPPTYLERACAMVRSAGGLVISDEVQAGFGRTGRMWGHELMGFLPDIVTMGKPMGNGYPISALVSRSDLVDPYRDKVFYFNTFAGAQVGVAAANAVLDAIFEDDLMANASVTGDYIRAGFAELAQKHSIISDIRGSGLWVGIELVRDRGTKEPATAETVQLVNRLKEARILLSRTGEFDNVLKMRPPLVFNQQNADQLLGAVEHELSRL